MNFTFNVDLICDPCFCVQMVMYMILGRFKQNPQVDLFRYVIPTTEDYLWLKARLMSLDSISHHHCWCAPARPQLTLVWESEDKLPDWLKDNQSVSLLHLQESELQLHCRPA